MSLTAPPEISVITVSKNNAAGLGLTAASVIGQTYSAIQYIVIDGASSDESWRVLEAYRDGIDSLISEPDNGIFDAMNKGLRTASGEWVIFLNAGDTFLSRETLERVAPLLAASGSARLCIGGTRNRYPSGFCKTTFPGTYDLACGMQFSHQSTFIRTKFHRENEFNMDDGVAADYGFFLRAQRQGVAFVTLPEVVSVFDVSGISSKNHLKNIVRERAIYRKYVGNPPARFLLRMVYAAAAAMVKRLIPEKATDLVRSWK